MARQLWLLRHAEAEPHGTRTDAERRLTKRGRQQARIAGVALGRLRASFDVVLYSPRVRARQTAELAAEAWSGAQRSRMQEHTPLAGGFDAAQALEAMSLAPVDGRVLLVGHEPDLSGVIAGLSGGRVDLKKGGLAALRLEGGSAELVLLMRPRELALIAGAGASRAQRTLLVGGVGGVPIYGE
jgi:phosphohistidine phosphatase